jgi:hypothetical protein
MAEQTTLPGDAGQAAAIIRSAAPEVRLALRDHPVVTAVIISDLLTRALAGRLDRGLAHDLDRALAREDALGLDHTDGLDNAVAAITSRRLALHLAAGLADGITRLLRHTDLAFEADSTRAFILAHDLALANSLGRDGERIFEPACELARNLARDLAGTVAARLGLANGKGVAAALLDGALDDFTQADLSGVDLAGVDLAGVRWSEQGTRWPPELDLEKLRRNSLQTPPGSDTHVVMRPEGKSRQDDPVSV